MRKIVFLTGTRADFGKLKSLIEITLNDPQYEVHIFVTGMHMQYKYGYTVDEIVKCGYPNIYKFINHTTNNSMDKNLGKTIMGFSDYVNGLAPDLIVVHGDRVETLAGSIVGSLNNILVAHIEGGEVSGTIDELIRHAVSKMSHSHFVSNQSAKKRLIQMGEKKNSIFEIGSPDIDVMLSDTLPGIDKVMSHYDINFNEYGVVLYHPVTTELDKTTENARELVEGLINSGKNFVVIYPNNDYGSVEILNEYKKLENYSRFKVFPSIRFEYFLVLLKNASCLVGNSSAGIREAPYYGVPTINIGSRQNNRALHNEIINCPHEKLNIESAINIAFKSKFKPIRLYGEGNSDLLFKRTIDGSEFWNISKQKEFKDLVNE